MAMPQQKRGRSKQDYQTPPEFLEAVKKRLHIDRFAIDLAASPENTAADVYFTEQVDSLKQDWASRTHMSCGWGWLNPPFGNIAPWVQKAAMEACNGAHVAMLVPASVGANWWTAWVEGYAYQSYLNGRLTFVGEEDPYPKDCALLLYTPWGFTGHEIWHWRHYINDIRDLS